MVDAKALKLAVLVVAGAVALLVASFVLRWVGRILSWAVLLALALGAGYVVYQLYAGWTAGEEGPSGTVDATADVESVKQQYADGDVSETELEAELADAVDEDDLEPELDG